LTELLEAPLLIGGLGLPELEELDGLTGVELAGVGVIVLVVVMQVVVVLPPSV